MKSGICPKCQSEEVYVLRQRFSNKTYVPIEWLAQFQLERYVCLSCGMSEEYMIAKDLENSEKLARIRSKFPKVTPRGKAH